MISLYLRSCDTNLIVQAAFGKNKNYFYGEMFTNICQKMLIANENVRVQMESLMKVATEN